MEGSFFETILTGEKWFGVVPEIEELMMPPLPKAVGLTLAVCLAISALAGCGDDNKTENGQGSQVNTDLAGDVKIEGSSTVAPISAAAANLFHETYPNVNITVGDKGTGDGFKAFYNGETDISDASRPIKPGEVDNCRKNGIEFIELPVAYDGLTIVVHPELAIDQITVEELKAVFSNDAQPRLWSDVNSNWPVEEIKIFAPGRESGTYDYFQEVILEGAEPRPYSTNSDDNALVSSVAGNKGSIGFFGASYYFGNTDKLKALKVINPQTGKAVAPTAETIESGEYFPLSRPLFIYVNVEKLRQPQVRIFVEDYLKNAGELAAKVSYVALPEEISKRAETHLKQKKTGTHFLDAEGNNRSGSLEEIYTEANLSGT